MVRKLTLLLSVILFVSCARNASQINTLSTQEDAVVKTYSAIWQNAAGDIGASNTVQGKLPTSTGSIGSTPTSFSVSGHQVYTSPLTFVDNSNVTYVLALWASSSSLYLVKYSFADNVLTVDTDFGDNGSIQLTADSSAFKAHQMAVNMESDQPFVYVTHASGITKYNALTGASAGSGYGNDGAMYRILISGSDIYAQSKTKVAKLDTTLTPAASSATFTSTVPSRQLPLVVSGSSIYVVFDAIYKLNLSTLVTEGSESVLAGESVSAIAAFSDSVVYSRISLVNKDLSGGGTPSKIRIFSDTEFKVFGNDNFDRTPTSLYSSYSYNRYDGTYHSSVGDYSFTALAVSGTSMYLPSYLYGMIANTHTTPNAGLSLLNTAVTPTPTVTSIYGSTDQLIGTTNGFDLHYVSRFVVVDATTGKTFAVMNVNETLFTTSGTYTSFTQHSDASTQIKDDSNWSPVVNDGTVDISNQTTNYNTRIRFGNSTSSTEAIFSDTSIAIQAIGVGDKFIVLSANNGKLYTFQ